MLEECFSVVYDKFRLSFYRKIFDLVRERDGSLSAMECFSLEIIRMLDKPTISQFADFLSISQSNATYKVNSLMKKGYIERENSLVDRREYHLVLSDKYYDYLNLMDQYQHKVIGRMENRFSEEELSNFAHVLNVMSAELMPECDK